MTVMVAGDPEYRAECAVWQNITDSDTAVPMTCDTNVQCTGIDCSCEFSYNVRVTGSIALCGNELTVHVVLKVYVRIPF